MTPNSIPRSGHESWPDGVGMIYLAMAPWAGMWKNRHQLMSRFAKDIPVLYVEPPVRLRELRRTLVGITTRRRSYQRTGTDHVGDNLYVFHSSPYYAVSGSHRLGRMTTLRWFRAVLRAASAIGIQEPILWLSQPQQYWALDAGGHRLSVYHIVDEYAGYTGMTPGRRKQLHGAEQRLLDRVDLTVAVSPELVRAKSGPNRDLRLIENAVELRQFETARSSAESPADLQNIPRPRLGYSGLIGRRLDLELILDLARNRPQWSFVLVGTEDSRDCQQWLEKLSVMPNVYFLGEKEPSKVAAYVCGFDLGMLPYKVNVETRHISPLKMYEYLAAGIPVVATAIPAAERKQNIIAVADDSTKFEWACESALSSQDEQSITIRLDEAARNTWDQRITELTDLIGQKLSGLPPVAGR